MTYIDETTPPCETLTRISVTVMPPCGTLERISVCTKVGRDLFGRLILENPVWLSNIFGQEQFYNSSTKSKSVHGSS